MNDRIDHSAGISLQRLASQVVIVTGAAKGIGAAIAHRCAAEGAALVVVDRDEDALAPVLDALRRRDGIRDDTKASMVVGDISNETTIRAMVDIALANHGRLDGLVNNAGIFGAFARFEDNSLEAFDEIVSINIRAAWMAMQYAKPAMLASAGGGSIVNMASMAAMRANRGLSLYGMTKAAIANLTINAATEYAKHDIRVNAICPGPIDTDMLGTVEEFIDERHSDLARAQITRSIPLGRYGRPEEIAVVAALLLSSDAGFMTGARLADRQRAGLVRPPLRRRRDRLRQGILQTARRHQRDRLDRRRWPAAGRGLA